MPRTPSARQRILDSAHTLFYRDGFRATGVDRIIAESGVAKMTFYRHFPSKTQLIDAFLQMRHQRWMAWFEQGLAQRDASAHGIAVIAPLLGEWFETPDFRGCAFINALAEDGVQGTAIDAVRAHKQALRDCVRALAERRGMQPAGAGADAIMIVIEGAIVRAQTTADITATVAATEHLLRTLETAMRQPANARQEGRWKT